MTGPAGAAAAGSGEPDIGPPDAGGAGTGGLDASEPGATVLDCRGQRCPLPVIALARRLPELPPGAMIRVLADDPAAANDIPAWCRMRNQQFVGATSVDGTPAFDVRRTS